MSTILDELYSVPVISDALSDLKASTDNDGISGYNINGSVNKIPGGIINSLIKIFLAEQIGVLFLPALVLRVEKFGCREAALLVATDAQIFLLRFILPLSMLVQRADRQQNMSMGIEAGWVRIVDTHISTHAVCHKLLLDVVRQ